MVLREGYLIVSDLHVSQGRSPENGAISRNEDFFFDEEFRDFLEYHTQHSEYAQVHWTLILNGDFLDFLQVTDLPQDRPDLRADPLYGLEAGELESAWKLRRVRQGHPFLFEALAAFAEEHRIVLIPGNHDAAFYYPEVRRVLLELLVGEAGDRRASVEIQDWFFFDGTLWVEHGHQYDSLNSFDEVLDPRRQTDTESGVRDLDLPLGSLFVRYLFNRIETESPFADNIKPATRFFFWLLLNHPYRALSFCLTDGGEMLRRIRSRWQSSNSQTRHEPQALQEIAARAARATSESKKTWFKRLQQVRTLHAPALLNHPQKKMHWRLLRLMVGPFRTRFLVLLLLLNLIAGVFLLLSPMLAAVLPTILLKQLAAILGTPSTALALDSFRWLFLAELLLVSFWIIEARRRNRGALLKGALRQKARKIQSLTGASFVVFGHSHEPDVRSLKGGAKYLNCGTWTKVFGYESRVIREEKELTFVRHLAGMPEPELMKWEKEKMAPRRILFFDDL